MNFGDNAIISCLRLLFDHNSYVHSCLLHGAGMEHAIKIIMYPQETTRASLNHVEHSIRTAIQLGLTNNVSFFTDLFLVL